MIFFDDHDDPDFIQAEMLLIDDDDDDILVALKDEDIIHIQVEIPLMDGEASSDHDELYSAAGKILVGDDDPDYVHESKIPLIDDEEILAALKDDEHFFLN